jgi:hypothetical protein
MAEVQSRYDLCDPDDVRKLRSGVDCKLSPTGILRNLIWIDSSVEVDRIAIFVVSIDAQDNQSQKVFLPGMISWTLLGGIDCEFDKEVAAWDGFTNLAPGDLGYGRNGYLVRLQGFQATTFALLGTCDPSIGVGLIAKVKIIVAAGGSTATVAAVGNAAG